MLRSRRYEFFDRVMHVLVFHPAIVTWRLATELAEGHWPPTVRKADEHIGFSRLCSLFVVLCAIAFSGCAHQIKVESLNDGEPNSKEAVAYLASFDATRRASVIKIDKDGKMTIVSEVPPDAVISSVLELSAKVSGKLDAQGAAKFAESVTVLGRRTAAVNILRDALYRLGEMKSNGTLDTESGKLFEQVLQAAIKIAEAEENDSKAAFSQHQNELIKTLQALKLDKAEIMGIIQQ